MGKRHLLSKPSRNAQQLKLSTTRTSGFAEKSPCNLSHDIGHRGHLTFYQDIVKGSDCAFLVPPLQFHQNCFGWILGSVVKETDFNSRKLKLVCHYFPFISTCGHEKQDFWPKLIIRLQSMARFFAKNCSGCRRFIKTRWICFALRVIWHLVPNNLQQRLAQRYFDQLIASQIRPAVASSSVAGFRRQLAPSENPVWPLRESHSWKPF